MGISEYIRKQNYGWLLFNKNQPYNLWGWWVDANTIDENETSIDRVAKSFSNMRNQVKQRSNQQVISDLINSQNTMFWSAMSNRNKATSAQEMKAAQLDAFAAIVKWRAIEDGYEDEWDEYNNTKDIVSHYIDLNNSEEVNSRLIEYANSQEDPYEFALSMWVLLTPEQKRIRKAQNELDSLFWEWNTPKRLAKTYDFLANQMVGWLSSWAEPMEKWDFNEMFANSNSDEAPILWAIENYAYRTFWKHINNLDEYEMNKILTDLKDTETLEKYLPNEATAIANKFEWATYGALSTAFPLATLWIEWVTSIPVVWDIASWTLRNIARGIWQTLTYSILSPLAWPLSYNLNNEDERLDFYEALWAVFLWRDHENNWWATTRGKWDKKTEWAFNKFLHSDAKETLWSKLWEDVIGLDETAANTEWQTVLWWIKDVVKKKMEKNKRQKEFEKSIEWQVKEVASQRVMEDLAWTLLNNWKSDFNSKMKPDLSNWLANLPSRVLDWWTKTFEWLTREVQDAQWWIVDLQNAILWLFKSDKFKTSRENDNFTTTNWATVHPVADAILMLKKLYESVWDKDNLALLEKIEKKLDNGEITVLDKKNLARQISNEANSFTDSFELKTWKSAKEAELIREYLQQDVRNADPFLNEFMTTTDSVYSNLSKVKKFSSEKAEDVSTHRDQQKLPKIWRSIIKWTAPVIDTLLTQWKYIYDNAKKNAREPYKPTTLEKDIPTILKAFGEQKKSIPWKWFNISAFMEMVDKWNYNEKEYAYNNEINNFLEDIVESTDSNRTSKNRLNANDVPALEFILREAWATPEEIRALESNLWVVIQEPLFWEVDWQKANSKTIRNNK